MCAWCEDTADAYLAQHGLRVDADSRGTFVRAIADATQAAALSLLELSQGARRAFAGLGALAQMLVSNTPNGQSPPVKAVPESVARTAAVNFETLITGGLRERRPTPKTAYVCPRVVREFAASVGHGDAATVSEDDLIL
ncbi:hypothetical protein ACLBWX_22505 [Methylobacterium sp. M6A4_1b]